MMNQLDKLLNSIDVLSEYDREEYQKIEDPKVAAVTPRAALINGRWLAKSCLRTNMDGGIYVSCWLYAKEF